MKKIFLLLVLTIFLSTSKSQAADKKILFVPHDDRPISYHQTVEVAEAAGYEMILPPKEFLNEGRTDELQTWLEENIFFADSAVISSDAILYGGLIPSRKHEISEEILNWRLEKLRTLREKNPYVKIYIFDSLMRTPHAGTPGDIEEPEYYQIHGANIFQYTKLADKKEISGLSRAEENFFAELEKKIPPEILSDWMNRRKKNLAATKKLMDFTRDGIINYLIVGRDDNAPISQTHRENREILSYAEKNNLTETNFQSLPGIDEFNLLLLSRAINDLSGEIPFVNVQYNAGKGGDTVPAYSDEKISDSIKAAVKIAGGLIIPEPNRADFVLLVNTDIKGKTFHTHNPYPDGGEFKPILKPNDGTKYFAELVEKNLSEGCPVGIADITFANGSDNALMKILSEKNLLFKLQTYSGWNTATNSAGFAVGAGILAKKMTDDTKNKILAVRYLDDWAYQANVRTIVGSELVKNFGSPQFYFQLGDKLSWAENRNTELMKIFAEKNLPQVNRNFTIKNTWQRMFECDIIFN